MSGLRRARLRLRARRAPFALNGHRRAVLCMAVGKLALCNLAACNPAVQNGVPAVSGAPAGGTPDHIGPGVAGGGAALRAQAALEPEAPRIRALEPCVPANVEICFNALDDNCNGALDEGCGTPGGVVQFMIAWDSARADVDLNVTDPKGELIEAGRISESGLIKGRDCPGRRQECAGVNLENVFLEGSKAPTRGTYRLGISLEKLNGEEPPIWVTLSSRLGAKHYAYEIRLSQAEDEQRLELEL